MKKFMTLSIIFVLCLTMMTGCGSKASEDTSGWYETDSLVENSEKASVEFFAGEWECRDATHEEFGYNDAIYVGYMYMTINEDGTFKIINTEEDDQQVMGGKLEVVDEGNLRMECEGDFYPPECWNGVEMKQKLTYTFDYAGGKDILLLTYANADGVPSSLFFDRVK